MVTKRSTKWSKRSTKWSTNFTSRIKSDWISFFLARGGMKEWISDPILTRFYTCETDDRASFRRRRCGSHANP